MPNTSPLRHAVKIVTSRASIMFWERRTYFASGTKFTSAFIEFDSGEGWHVAGSQIVSNGSVNLFEVALHEIGPQSVSTTTTTPLR